MTLSPGARLGPYEILAPLGSGGMGEVYRAKDSRLSREVALKVLHEEVSADPGRLKRFENEARSASALNHPNIVTIYDVGRTDSVSWIAMERVVGTTLRQHLSGAVPVRRLLAIAAQIADGLATAHEAGIVHRDLKPDNVMVTKDGLVKILDFGLAKLAATGPADEGGSPQPVETGTFPGSVLGTVGYMSPEQASGHRVDFRSDQFALGSMLYEMATGNRAFQKKTSVETLTAILNEDPEPIERVAPRTPVPLRWIVERCLSKEPGRRYSSTRDLARELETVRDHSSEISGVSAPGSIFSAPRRWIRGLALALLVVGALAAGMAVGRREGRWEPPSFRRLTFREGEVSAARFAPDEQTVLYSALWGDGPIELFLHRLGGPESRPLGVSNASLQAISRLDEVALLLNPYQNWNTGTLARMAMVSVGAPREILEQVNSADWSPDGRELAIIHDDAEERSTLEYPIGRALYQVTAGFLSHARVSRDGRWVAVLDHPKNLDDSGSVVVLDRTGKSRVLAAGFETIWGLAWSPDGSEVWFTGAPTGLNRALYAVNLSGRQRVLARFMGLTELHDVAASGRALVIQDLRTEHVMALAPGEEKERELTWFDLSNSNAISTDGRMVVLLESGEGGGPGYSTFLRKTDGSPAVRLGEGDGQALSPDGRWVVAILGQVPEPALVLYPTGAGQARRIPLPGLQPQYAEWMPDGKQILLSAGEAGRGSRVYLVSVTGGKPRAISAEGFTTFSTGSVSPDGKRAVVWGPGDRLFLYPLDGGDATLLPGLTAGAPCGWSADGTRLYVVGMERTVPQRVDLLDVRTGKRELWKKLGPRTGARDIHVTPDGRAYVYSFVRKQEALYLVEGLK